MEIKNHQLQPNPRKVDLENSQDDIYLTIKIGNGQIGGNKVSSVQGVLAKGNLNELTYLGTVENLLVSCQL